MVAIIRAHSQEPIEDLPPHEIAVLEDARARVVHFKV